jgi:NADH-quinone oxidoreductase subunit G
MEMRRAQIIVDGVPVDIDGSNNLLAACLSARLDLPYFCWHPALGSVGACRQCAVTVYKDDQDTVGQTVMACMTVATPGMIVSLTDKKSQAIRKSVIELALTNHPHDCPVCEVGGDCHLQDMTAITGHSVRHYEFPKRTHLNQELGPFIKHEMNRCISCYRCVRFYRDYAGGTDFGVFGASRNVYFGRPEDGALESEFAGNLVEVCPTGVFVDKPYATRFVRKWDMRAMPSVCPHCAIGCNVTIQEREGEFRRASNRFNAAVNGYFLCDRGRFGIEFVNRPKLTSAVRRSGSLVVTNDIEARAHLRAILKSDMLIGIGSPRASLESNFMLGTLVGPDRFYAGTSEHQWRIAAMAAKIIAEHGVPTASIADVEASDCVMVIGDDPSDVAPRLGLAVRQVAKVGANGNSAVVDIPDWHADARKTAQTFDKPALFIATSLPTRLDDLGADVMRGTAEQLTELCSQIERWLVDDGDVDHAPQSLSGRAGVALRCARKPVIIVGGGAGGADLLGSAANIVLASRDRGADARLVMLLPEVNSLGLALLQPRSLDGLIDQLASGQQPGCIALENDFVRHLSEEALGNVRRCGVKIAVLDHIDTRTTQAADVTIRCANFVEASGTVVNAEGRAQLWHQAIFSGEPAAPAWEILRDCGVAAELIASSECGNREAILIHLIEKFPIFRNSADLITKFNSEAPPMPSLPFRYSGRTAVNAHIDVREAPPPPSSHRSWSTSMEGARLHPDAEIVPQFWAPGWNSGQAVNQFQTGIGLSLRTGDEGVLLFPQDCKPGPIERLSATLNSDHTLIFCEIAPVFGGEALSARSAPIRERMGDAVVLIGVGLADSLAIQDGARVRCDIGDLSVVRRAVIVQSIAENYCGITANAFDQPDLLLPQTGRIARISDEGQS